MFIYDFILFLYDKFINFAMTLEETILNTLIGGVDTLLGFGSSKSSKRRKERMKERRKRRQERRNRRKRRL